MGAWNKLKLGNACQISKGQQLNKIDLEKSGDYPCINGGVEPSGYTDKWNTEANTITISEGGNSCGYVNFLTTRFWSGGHCYSILDLKNSIDVNFLYQALKGRESLIMGLRVGSGLPNIQQKAIREFEFIYPEDKPEQTRIAQILSKADSAISQTEALIAKYQRIKTGLMQDLLTRGIDENGNIRSKKTHRFVVINGIEVPEEWEVKAIGDITTHHKQGIFTQLSYQKSGVYLVRITDLQNPDISFDEMPMIDLSNREYQQFKLEKGDFLFARSGAIGRYGIFNSDLKSVFGSYIIKFKFNDCLLNEFFGYYFEYFIMGQQLKKIIQGSSNININAENIKSLKTILPSKEEQINILQKLRKQDKLIRAQKNVLDKLILLKIGLMQDLLSGKVRAKIDEKALVNQ